MGGNGALKLAFKYPELFGSVVAYAGSYKRLPLDGYFAGVAAAQQAWIAKLSQWYSPDDDVFELAKKNQTGWVSFAYASSSERRISPWTMQKRFTHG